MKKSSSEVWVSWKQWRFTGPNRDELSEMVGEIFGHGCYYVGELRSLGKILDVGGYVGVASCWLANAYPDRELVVFEPNPKVYEFLDTNLKVNKIEAEVVKAGVAKFKGKRSLYIDSSGAQWWSTASFSNGGWSKKQLTEQVNVQVMSLRDYLNSEVALLKLDVEGAELEILESVRDLLGYVETVVVEYHPGKKRADELIRLLTKSGFEVKMRDSYRGKSEGEKGLKLIVGHRRKKD